MQEKLQIWHLQKGLCNVLSPVIILRRVVGWSLHVVLRPKHLFIVHIGCILLQFGWKLKTRWISQTPLALTFCPKPLWCKGTECTYFTSY
jgi:hypothetical protein